MGPCMSQKHTRSDTSIPLQYKQDRQLQYGVLQPLHTTLYNLLRRANDLEILRANPKQSKIFFKETSPNLDDLTPTELKMFFSFKNILIIGQYQSIFKKLKQATNPKAVYAISQSYANKFATNYPIFGPQSQIIQPKMIPIFAFSSSQIVNSAQKKQIFLHSEKFKNDAIYSQIRANQIINDAPTNSLEQASEMLINSNSQRIVFLHSSSRSQDDLLNVLSSFASTQYKMSSLGSKIYIRRCLPQTTIDDVISTFQNIPASSKSISNGENPSLTEIYNKHLRSLYSQMGGDEKASKQLDRAYNLLVVLVSNIYNNKGSDSYRRIRKTNSQINELLGKYKYGQKLLSEVGFKDDGSGYLNNTDVKYLKIYRTDLDMAYRNFINNK